MPPAARICSSNCALLSSVDFASAAKPSGLCAHPSRVSITTTPRRNDRRKDRRGLRADRVTARDLIDGFRVCQPEEAADRLETERFGAKIVPRPRRITERELVVVVRHVAFRPWAADDARAATFAHDDRRRKVELVAIVPIKAEQHASEILRLLRCMLCLGIVSNVAIARMDLRVCRWKCENMSHHVRKQIAADAPLTVSFRPCMMSCDFNTRTSGRSSGVVEAARASAAVVTSPSTWLKHASSCTPVSRSTHLTMGTLAFGKAKILPATLASIRLLLRRLISTERSIIRVSIIKSTSPYGKRSPVALEPNVWMRALGSTRARTASRRATASSRLCISIGVSRSFSLNVTMSLCNIGTLFGGRGTKRSRAWRPPSRGLVGASGGVLEARFSFTPERAQDSTAQKQHRERSWSQHSYMYCRATRLSRTLCHSCVLDVIFLTLPWWMDSERKRYANVYKHHKTAAAKHTDSVQPLPTPRIRTRNMRATRSHRRLSTPCSTIFIPAATQRRANCKLERRQDKAQSFLRPLLSAFPAPISTHLEDFGVLLLSGWSGFQNLALWLPSSGIITCS